MNNKPRRPELLLTDEEARRQLRSRTRRGFVSGGIASLAGIAGYEWLTRAGDDNGVPWPQRDVLDWNGKLWHAVSGSRLMPSFAAADVQPLKPNGGLGLDDPVGGDWKLQVNTGTSPALSLGLADIKALPRVEMITRFCCIEGWSVITHWTGARFSDFTKKYFPVGRALPRYVSMNTPDEQYYVGLDMKSALHPQTLLAYELNGQPLTETHGAPLRLAIPVKYGVKNIKRIGTIKYTDSRPDDYWAEDGYDWYAGL
jgi:DMSO/TMAO reductase YedYZ molybdopterin-dependent catalytic subunit